MKLFNIFFRQKPSKLPDAGVENTSAEEKIILKLNSEISGLKLSMDELKQNPSSIIFNQPHPEREARPQPSGGK